MADEATTREPVTEAPEEEGHYEVVSEYRVGEGPPPIALIVIFFIIVLWASTSWYPLFGY